MKFQSNKALKLKLPISEMFVSLAGEGLDIGKPSLFIRIMGCPKPWCRYCDTKYAREIPSNDFIEKEGLSINTLCADVVRASVGHVTVTGGNPLYYVKEVRSLVKLLKSCGFFVTLQEKGQCYDKETWETVDCVDFDVKTPFTGIESNLDLVSKLRPGKDYLKFLIASLRDFEFFKKFLISVYPKCEGLTCVLQPGIRPFENEENMWQRLKLIVDFVLKSGLSEKVDIRILPQLHKQLFGMRKRGV